MKNLNDLAKRAVSGDQNALQKLLTAAEDDIRFICTAFFGADTEKHLQKVINIIYARISSYYTSSDIVYTIRRQTAEICIEISGFRIFTDSIPSVSVTSTNPKFRLAPPEDIVREDTRVNASQRVCTVFEGLSQTGELDTEALQEVSDRIILDVIQRHAQNGSQDHQIVNGGHGCAVDPLVNGLRCCEAKYRLQVFYRKAGKRHRS